jgi:hypothetical protein
MWFGDVVWGCEVWEKVNCKCPGRCKPEYYVVPMCQALDQQVTNPVLGKRHKSIHNSDWSLINFVPGFELDFASRRESGPHTMAMGRQILRAVPPKPGGPWPLSAVTVNLNPSRGAVDELKVRKKRNRKEDNTYLPCNEPTLNDNPKLKYSKPPSPVLRIGWPWEPVSNSRPLGIPPTTPPSSSCRSRWPPG